MPVGTMVYHTILRMNLIVCQVDANGKIICVNPKVYDDDRFQVFTVDVHDLIKGWKTIYY